jgi:hypothetical protein
MHPKLLDEHSSPVRAAFREYTSVVQADFERIARQNVQGSKTLLVPIPGEFQDVAKIDAALVADAMVGY